MRSTHSRSTGLVFLTAPLLASFFSFGSLTARQQPTTTPQVRPGTGVYPETQPDDNSGFVSIFDGKTLNGWDGDTTFWRVENGEIVGETTPEKVMKQNSFLIWRGGTVKDFELKVEFRMNGTNSGIQYPQLGTAQHRQMGTQGIPGRP